MDADTINLLAGPRSMARCLFLSSSENSLPKVLSTITLTRLLVHFFYSDEHSTLTALLLLKACHLLHRTLMWRL